MAPPANPIVVIVPAACHPPPLYTPLANALSPLGLRSHAVALPSIGVSPGLKSFDEDVAAIRDIVMGLVEKGEDVVLLMHSYGGLPGSEAVKGLGKTQREKEGKKGGVARLVYVCAFVLAEGERMQGAGDVKGMKGMVGEGFDEENMTLSMSPKGAIMSQYHDLPSPAEAEHWAAQLKSQSVGSLWSTQTYAAYRDIPSAYVICTLDRIIQPQKQEKMIKEAQKVQSKAFDVVESLESGHVPILSLTPQLADVVKKAVDTEGW